jgi:antitoxin component of MazEF toxin-antitoxin module
MSLPASLRKALGVSKGGTVVLQETDAGLLLTTPAQALAKLQEWARKMKEKHPELSVDEFIAERRREAAREETEYQKSLTRRR